MLLKMHETYKFSNVMLWQVIGYSPNFSVAVLGNYLNAGFLFYHKRFASCSNHSDFGSQH